jgi:CheY-like chemotaxis protein
MELNGPIILVDDDVDDLHLFSEAFHSIGVTDSMIRVFDKTTSALQYLETTRERPFIILCDINLPEKNGLEFRQQINNDEYLRRKSIPFVFLSTTAQPREVALAYDLTVQGFFVKSMTFTEMQASCRIILEYWKNCIHPNSVK